MSVLTRSEVLPLGLDCELWGSLTPISCLQKELQNPEVSTEAVK